MFNVTWDDLHAQMAWKSVKFLAYIVDNSPQMFLSIRNANQAPRSTF